MAISQFDYTKSWRDSEDFPTYESREEKVRDDMQSLFDEIRDALNTVISALISTATGSSGAKEIGVSPIVGLTGYHNVQDALAGLKAAVDAATTGTIPDGSLTTAKLVDSAVTTAKLADGAVTEDKLHSAAVTRNKIATGAVNANRCDFSSGINFPGPVRLSKNVVLTAGETYGTSSQLPEDPLEGQIFFVKV